MKFFKFLLNFALFAVSVASEDSKTSGSIFSLSELASESKSFPGLPIKFLLYTRENRNEGREIKVNDSEAFLNSLFDSEKPTRFIIHGWNDDSESITNLLIRTFYLDVEDVNVIAVDWSNGTKTQSYIAARNKIQTMATHLADFISFLRIKHELNVNTTYLIGHNLGAHVAGIAGKQLKNQGNIIAAIIGLDPALPLFSLHDYESRLFHGDAKYIQTIHTCGSHLGFQWPIGDAAFYPNWGRSQPACSYDDSGRCSDSIAAQYFAMTLQSNNRFLGKKCENFDDIRNQKCRQTDMDDGFFAMGGEPLDTEIKGIFYLPVEERYPFALGEFENDNEN